MRVAGEEVLEYHLVRVRVRVRLGLGLGLGLGSGLDVEEGDPKGRLVLGHEPRPLVEEVA